jgi:hypothetical protein
LCTKDYLQSIGVEPGFYALMNSSLGFTVVAGIASTILLATICIPVVDKKNDVVGGRRLSMLKLLFMVLSGGMLIGNRLFWTGKIVNMSRQAQS